MGSMMKSSAPVIRSVRCPIAPVRAHPREPGGERAGQQLAVEELPRVVAQPFDRRVFETSIERPQEVTAVPAVQREQRRSLANQIGDEASPP